MKVGVFNQIQEHKHIETEIIRGWQTTKKFILYSNTQQSNSARKL